MDIKIAVTTEDGLRDLIYRFRKQNRGHYPKYLLINTKEFYMIQWSYPVDVSFLKEGEKRFAGVKFIRTEDVEMGHPKCVGFQHDEFN